MGGKTHFGRARGLGVVEDGAAVKAGGRKQLKFSQMLRGQGQASERLVMSRSPRRREQVPWCLFRTALRCGRGRRVEGGAGNRPGPRLHFGGRSRGRSLPLGRARKCWACPGHKEAMVF